MWLMANVTGAHAALPVRHMATFDVQGRADFAGVRAGHWSFETLTPTWDDDFAAFPMPAVEARAVAATTGQYAVAAPNRALFVLSSASGAGPALEVTAPVDGPRLIPLRYLDRLGVERRLLLAIAPALTGPARSRTVLPGFAPGTPWESGDHLEAGVLTAADGPVIAESIRAAHHRPTRHAWEALACEARPEVASIIEATLVEK